MGIVSRYWTLVSVNTAGQRTVGIVEPAHTFFQQNFAQDATQEHVLDAGIQKTLFKHLHQTSDLSSGAEWCLRCWISHGIEQVCIQLENQFGQEHGFRRYDLFPFVLQDRYPPRRQPLQTSGYPLLFSKILQTYRLGKGSLATWVIRLTRSDRDLNAFLLDRGIYLVSDWAILNDTTPQQAERILSQFHCLTHHEVEEASLLLKSYHAVYRQDRVYQRQTGAVGQCPDPSITQLDRMRQCLRRNAPERSWGPALRLLAQLQTLAQQLRQYRIAVRQKKPAQFSIEQAESWGTPLQLASPCPDETAEIHNEFLLRYRAQFKISLDQAIDRSLGQRLEKLHRHQPQKAQQFLRALYLFHCQGQAMADIAPQVGLKAQYQVSRLLQLKDLRADVQRQTLVELRGRVVEQAQAFADPVRLETLRHTLDTLLSEQIDAMIQEATAEASIPGNRPIRSLYTRRLCHDLDRRIKP